MTGRTREELQAENHNLRCFLWLAVRANGGRITITKAALEQFNPTTSRLEFWTGLQSGDYYFEANEEQPK